jgi:hypothetical protein
LKHCSTASIDIENWAATASPHEPPIQLSGVFDLTRQ